MQRRGCVRITVTILEYEPAGATIVGVATEGIGVWPLGTTVVDAVGGICTMLGWTGRGRRAAAWPSAAWWCCGDGKTGLGAIVG